MGILSGIFRSRDKPVDRTAGSSFAFYLGSSTSGKYVTERSAMQMTAVYSCVRILSVAVRKKRWIIRFIFCSMMSRIRR